MVDRVNGGVSNAEFLSGNLQWFTITTVCDITTGAWGSSNSGKRNLDTLITYINTRAQPMNVSVGSEAVDLSVAANRTFYGLGTDYNQAATTVWTLKFSIDKSDAWNVSGDDANLLTDFDGMALPFETTGIPITGPSTRDVDTLETSSSSAKNIQVTKNEINSSVLTLA